MKPITVYCAHCHRPLLNHNRFDRITVRTEACLRQQVFVRITKGGQSCWYSDGSEVECSVVEVLPDG